MNIQWYPGHMTKAKRMMQENIKLIDVVVELVDARVPVSSQNPEIHVLAHQKPRIMVFNKVDLADPAQTDQWEKHFKEDGYVVVKVNSRDGQGMKQISQAVNVACKEKIERNKRRGLINKPMRAMVVGIPNVGKSTFINKLVGKAGAKTGNKPGVTKGKQWLKLKNEIELLDTPGVLWPKFDDKQVGIRLAMIGSIKEEILDTEALASHMIAFMMDRYPSPLEEKFGVKKEDTQDVLTENPEDAATAKGYQLLEVIALKRNFIKGGGEADTLRTSKVLLEEFRNGKMGKLTLETVEDYMKPTS